MHSSTKPQFIYQNDWFNTIPPGKKTWLTVRNDDMYYLRWGDPDFVRAYLTNLPDRRRSPGSTWARTANVGTGIPQHGSRTPAPARDRENVVQLPALGRLAYEPTPPNGRFEQILGSRFPGEFERKLFAGWTRCPRTCPC